MFKFKLYGILLIYWFGKNNSKSQIEYNWFKYLGFLKHKLNLLLLFFVNKIIREYLVREKKEQRKHQYRVYHNLYSKENRNRNKQNWLNII